MAIHIQVLKDFVNNLVDYDSDCLIWVDEDGLSLESESGGYIEVGGKPEND